MIFCIVNKSSSIGCSDKCSEQSNMYTFNYFCKLSMDEGYYKTHSNYCEGIVNYIAVGIDFLKVMCIYRIYNLGF